jgi:hypothetical protein
MAARDPGTGSKMPDSLIIDNVVIFLMVGQETTAQALTGLYICSRSLLYICSRSFRNGRKGTRSDTLVVPAP